MSSGAMKGHLCLKSGPYASTSSKYTTQLLVKSHLEAHHRMVSNAKCAIDNKVPKAWQHSQKVRDQLKRDIIKNGRPPPSRSTSRSSQHSEERYKEELFDDDPVVGEIVRNHLPRRGRHSPNAVLTTRTADGAQQQSPRFTSTGDVLQDRKHAFTQPDRPFTPRTLKSTRKSKLGDFKYYNPPPPKNKSAYKSIKSDAKTATTSENLTFEPLRSRGFPESNDAIPRLDITVDKDHLKWLEEQATKAKVRTSARYDPKNSTATRPRTDARPTNATLDHEEEELKYLDFIKGVTNDVLDRGIYTNKALQSIFDSHVERNMDKLSVTRMNELLEKLRLDLGISDSATQESRDPDVESRASTTSRGSGLERYKRNLEKSLRDADLDTSIAQRGPYSLGSEISADEAVEDVLKEIHSEDLHQHPPQHPPPHSSPEYSEDYRSRNLSPVLDDGKSEISAIQSIQSHKSSASVAKSEKTQASVARSEKTQASSVARSERTQASSVARSERSRASVARSDKTQASVARSDKTQASVDRSERTQASSVAGSERTRASSVARSERTQASSVAGSERTRASSVGRSEKSERSRMSMAKSEARSEKSVPASDVSAARSERGRGSVAKSERSQASVARSGRSQTRSGTSQQPTRSNASTLKDDNYSVISDASKRGTSHERYNDMPDNNEQELNQSGKLSFAENGHSHHELDQSDVNSLAKDYDQLDLESEADTTVDGSLTSTMHSDIGEEHKWMKNPSNFTMTLKPGQLDMTVVKPRARARRRMSEERRSSLQDSPNSPRSGISERNSEVKPSEGMDSTLTDVTVQENKVNGRPVARPRNAAIRSEADNYSDGSDDF